MQEKRRTKGSGNVVGCGFVKRECLGVLGGGVHNEKDVLVSLG